MKLGQHRLKKGRAPLGGIPAKLHAQLSFAFEGRGAVHHYTCYSGCTVRLSSWVQFRLARYNLFSDTP